MLVLECYAAVAASTHAVQKAAVGAPCEIGKSVQVATARTIHGQMECQKGALLIRVALARMLRMACPCYESGFAEGKSAKCGSNTTITGNV